MPRRQRRCPVATLLDSLSKTIAEIESTMPDGGTTAPVLVRKMRGLHFQALDIVEKLQAREARPTRLASGDGGFPKRVVRLANEHLLAIAIPICGEDVLLGSVFGSRKKSPAIAAARRRIARNLRGTIGYKGHGAEREVVFVLPQAALRGEAVDEAPIPSDHRLGSYPMVAALLGIDHSGLVGRIGEPARVEHKSVPVVRTGPGGEYVRDWPAEEVDDG
jgi:hypothetical protein